MLEELVRRLLQAFSGKHLHKFIEIESLDVEILDSYYAKYSYLYQCDCGETETRSTVAFI